MFHFGSWFCSIGSLWCHLSTILAPLVITFWAIGAILGGNWIHLELLWAILAPLEGLLGSHWGHFHTSCATLRFPGPFRSFQGGIWELFERQFGSFGTHVCIIFGASCRCDGTQASIGLHRAIILAFRRCIIMQYLKHNINTLYLTFSLKCNCANPRAPNMKSHAKQHQVLTIYVDNPLELYLCMKTKARRNCVLLLQTSCT